MKTYGWFSEIYDRVKDSFEYKLKTLEFEVTEKIVALMSKRNMNRADLAGKLGTSKAAVSKLLNDGSNVTLKRLLKISEALDCEVKVEIVPIEQNASVYEVVIPVFISLENSNKYWLGSIDSRGQVRGSADHYHWSFTKEAPDDASAA
jgi:DNA-binding Xre family transcriptional regulator